MIMIQQIIKMSAYQTNKKYRHTQKTYTDIPKNKDVDIPSKNNNQSSVLVKVPRNKVSNQLFNSDIVNNHVSTNNKDVRIPNQKKCRHTPKKPFQE